MKLSKASLAVGGFLLFLIGGWIAVQAYTTRPTVDTSDVGLVIKPSEGVEDAVYLLDKLPFTQEEVQKIFVQAMNSDQAVEVPDARNYVILQNLAWLNMEDAAAEAATSTDDKEEARLRFQVKNGTYEYLYNLKRNTIEADGKDYYADDQVYLLVNELLKPDSELGGLETLLEKSRLEMERQDSSLRELPKYAAKQLIVGDNNYQQWSSYLKGEEPEAKIPFYSDGTGQVQYLKQYNQGIYELHSMIIFKGDQHQTPDGVHTGMSRQQVLDKLGKPNLETATLWGYLTNDYLALFFYFTGDELAFMALPMPA
ncbi:hypothetical protein ACFOQM_09970 [Paenibacillus sp. GCM10012307]|uniref:Uncharacterized protein n=1 Tax=Paenibacillus roseus TaxID=2798579 RepID=A0A934MQ84_9BACL|nr:hypothetical protein [Paenibacillus roseus]MBJ6361613.1 hypothetical protein [Paenibacillus roseus]